LKLEKEMEEDFRSLAMAALQVSGGILNTLNGDQVEALERATRAGARVVLEFGPIPEFESAELYLVEVEGRRHRLGGVIRAQRAMQ
jgi:hypothetical protein